MKGKKEIVIGVTIIIAVLLLIFGINYLKGINFFNSNRSLVVMYDDVQTLVPGSLIKYKGQQVGVVEDIYIEPTSQEKLITILNIADPDLRIPHDSKAKLVPEALGTSYIELILGHDTLKLPNGEFKVLPSKGPFLQPKDTITADYKFGLTEMLTSKVAPVEVKVNSVLGRVDDLLASVEKVVGKDGKELSSIMYSLKTSLNTLSSTVSDADNLIKANSQTITNTLKNVESVTRNLKKSNEKVTKLIANFTDLSDTLKNTDITGTVKEAKEALAGVSKMMDEINNGDGSAHQLIYNDSLINNVNGMIQEAQTLVENIKAHPNRYLQFAVFGSKDKGVKLDSREEKKLKQMLKN